jgi:hypothetical protein
MRNRTVIQAHGFPAAVAAATAVLVATALAGPAGTEAASRPATTSRAASSSRAVTSIPAGAAGIAPTARKNAELCKATGHWYELVADAVTWPQAAAKARALSHKGLRGHLAIVTSQEENDFLTAMLRQRGPQDVWQVWLGGLQPPGSEEPKGGWCWMDGEPMDYTHWFSCEPNNSSGSEDYTLIMGVPADTGAATYLGWWNDAEAGSLHPFIVEYE